MARAGPTLSTIHGSLPPLHQELAAAARYPLVFIHARFTDARVTALPLQELAAEIRHYHFSSSSQCKHDHRADTSPNDMPQIRNVGLAER